MNQDDPMGLKKLEKTLSELGKFEKPKIFEQPKPVYTKNFQQTHNKSLKVAQSGIETAKIVIDETKKTINAFKKIINKNKIPKSYNEVMEMRDRLIKEEEQRKEIKKAVDDIKELQKRKKEDQDD